MRIENNFHVPVPREQAWRLLTDVSRVADCLPGAKLTENAGAGVLKKVSEFMIGRFAQCLRKRVAESGAGGT